MSTASAATGSFDTIPARLDRLNWTPFHTRMVAGLGAAWILDGLQITIASSVTGVLQPETLGMTSTEIGLIASVYLIGELVGALVFGRMSDQLGRKRLLIMTLLLYLLGTGLAAFVTGHHTGWLVFFYATRFIAGMGIGGQYAAINSAIDEMMPSKYRGRVDIWINGTYWAGAIIGSFVSLIFLNASRQRRLAAGVPDGPGAGAGRHRRRAHAAGEPALADDPRPGGGGRERARQDRGRKRKSGQTLERRRRQQGDLAGAREAVRLPVLPAAGVPGVPEAGDPRRHADDHPVVPVQRDLLHLRPGATKFYDVSATKVPIYGWPSRSATCSGRCSSARCSTRWAAKDDRRHLPAVGRAADRQRLAVRAGVLTATTQTFVWVVIFFFASAGASAAYLTVSETWPIEIRAEAIAVFFAIAQIFGALGPAFYGCADRRRHEPDRPGHRLRRRRPVIMVIGGVVESSSGSTPRASPSRTSPNR